MGCRGWRWSRCVLCWRMVLTVARRAGGAFPPRRSLCSRSPGARGCAPLPPVPYPRQAELAGFCALSRACCASRRWFCAGARSDPTVCALVRAPSAPLALLAVPGGEGLRAPTPGPLPAASCACRLLRAAARVLRFAQVFLCSRTERPACVVLAHASTRMFVLAHGATRRVCRFLWPFLG